MSAASKQTLEYLHQQELIINGLCEGSENPLPFLGGLGKERTSDLAEERAQMHKCGNIVCKVQLDPNRERCASKAKAFLSSRLEIVMGRDLEQFCSEECFLSFRALVNSRPAEDVWNLQLKVEKPPVSSTSTAPGPATTTTTTPSPFVVVKEIKEKSKPSKKAKEVPLERGGVETPHRKTVTFADEQDDDDDQDGKEDGDLMSFFQPIDPSEFKLDLFPAVMGFFMQVYTNKTQEIFQNGFPAQPISAKEETGHNQVGDDILDALKRCKMVPSDLFEEASEAIMAVVHTFDLSRKLPRYMSRLHYQLIAVAIVGAWVERFPFQYENELTRNDLLACYAVNPELRAVDPDSFRFLKWKLIHKF